MYRIKLIPVLLVAVVLVAVVVQADSNKQVPPAKSKAKTTSPIKAAPTNTPQTRAIGGPRQGYLMVTEVLDGFGGESESDNYRIPVNSGGQPSAIGLSESADYGVEAGYVHASHVDRGDVTADGIINVADIVHLVNYLYRGGSEPCPVESGDVTCDGIVNVADLVFLVNYLYRGGDPPAC